MPSDSIYLHPEKGLNPRLTICEACGGETNALIMLGINDVKFFEYKCPTCLTKYLLSDEAVKETVPTNGLKCRKCGTRITHPRLLSDHEPIPYGV